MPGDRHVPSLERAPGNGRTVRGQLHLHALSVAVTASAAAEAGRLGAEGAHLAGLLHDMGKLVLPLAFGDEAVDTISPSRWPSPRRHRTERTSPPCSGWRTARSRATRRTGPRPSPPRSPERRSRTRRSGLPPRVRRAGQAGAATPVGPRPRADTPGRRAPRRLRRRGRRGRGHARSPG
ncbi:MAG: HDOD domain-containing protein, partial [Solirubrobacterales bacterium]|nr:HDOD domain-containing protein [Solirubrobacterales bacterium]